MRAPRQIGTWVWRVSICAAALSALAGQASAQGRFLGKEEILLYGLGLRVEPATQTVPKDIATIVSTYLQAPQAVDGLPPFAPDAVVKATLRGPGLPVPLDLQARPNSPLSIPPLAVAGEYALENIRLESQGQLLLRSTPETARITVIDKLLVTQITARALSAAEIREKGIVFDSSNFQAYNFTAAFALKNGEPINVNFPVVLPSLASVASSGTTLETIAGIRPPSIPSLKTVIPDTLKLATQIPNLTVMGFQLEVPQLKGQDLMVPPIPGVIVIPGDIGFLNQYFSVMLMVGNAAPVGSGLSVTDLQAQVLLPPGSDRVAGSLDDPLRMAMTARGEAPRTQAVVQAGPDGKLGTGDDLVVLAPGESGNAEFLVEGRREGSHTVEMAITGTLLGLPVGPVPITGRAIGAVLVRNPVFTLTFTHPDTVMAGEQYSLDVTVSNTSTSPANFVSVNLFGPNVSGASVIGEPTREIESIPPGDSATVTFDLLSRVSGRVTASTLDSDENVAGRFQLKSAVGADGIPLSPDSLVLPKEASSLPKSLRDAALGLLGKAWAVATAPAGALPKDVARFSKQIVLDRAVEVAEAGFRVSLHEPTPDSAAQLLMDFAGSNYGRIAELYPTADQLFHRDNFAGFDALRRTSVRGDAFAAAVASLLAPGLAAEGPAAFHQALGTKWAYRPGFVSVLVSSPSAPAPMDVAIVDAQGRRVGGAGANGKLVKEIPFSDVLPITNGLGQRVATLLLLAAPEAGAYTIRLTRVDGTPGDAASTLSILAPTAAQDGDLQQFVFQGVTAGSTPVSTAGAGDPIRFAFEVVGADVAPSPSPLVPAVASIPDGPPSVISVVQQAGADVVSCGEDSPVYQMGRVVAVLFSEEISAASIQDRLAAERITAFAPAGNQAAGVALQPGRRIAFVAFRRPFGPHVARTMTVTGAEDLRAHAMADWTGAMEATLTDPGAVVSGRILQGDETAVGGADVRLYAVLPCGDPPAKVGVSSQFADAEGRYQWDFVNASVRAVVTGIDPATQEFRSIPFDIGRDGQRMNVDVVLLGRGTFLGRVLGPDGHTPLAGSQLRVTSLTDHSQYGATTDGSGAFVIPRVPVGNIFVEAVSLAARAHYNFSEYIPFAGATVSRDIVLVAADVQQRTVKYAALSGYVLRGDGASAVPGVPVVAYYQNGSQPAATCPPVGDEVPAECAVGLATTAADGSFQISQVPAGLYRIYSFDQPSLAQGEVRYTLGESGGSLTILLGGGLGTVRGVVVDSTGARVAGARVGGGLTLSTADANGEFTLTDVPVGRRSIVAVSDALGVSGSAEVDVLRAGEVINVTIVLPVSGSVAGRVVLADGSTPAANVPVYVFRKTGNGSIQVLGQALTDAAGAYRIDHLVANQYEVSAFAADFSDGNVVPAVLRYNGQVVRADVRFRGAGGRVSGTVYNSDGTTPLAARVGLTGYRAQIAGGKIGVGFVPVANYTIVDTALDGRYSFSGLLVGDFTLRAVGQFSPDPIEASARIEAAGASVTLDLRLQATSQVAGIVYQPDGVTPAPNVNVTYKSDEFRVVCSETFIGGQECTLVPQGVQAEYAVTDAAGRFLVPLVNAGAFTLSFEDPATGKVAQQRGLVRPGERAEIEARLLGRGTLTIRVVGSDNLTPIPGARVEVQQTEFPKASRVAFADASGTLVLSGGDALSEGEAAILARDVRNGFTGRGSARVSADNEEVTVVVHLFDAWGTVSGTVYKADGITPVANAEVVLSANGRAIGFALTDANGLYSHDTVPLGSFTIDTFEAASGRTGYGSGSIDVDKQQVIVNLTQLAMGLVTGTALDSSLMAPLPGWSVTLTSALSGGRTRPALHGMTAADGQFSFPGVPQGTFQVHVRNSGVSGSASGGGEIRTEGQVVDVPLLVPIPRPLYGSLEGTVLNPDGSPAAYAAVTVASGPATTAAADGTFSFPQLQLGRYQVVARAQDSANAGSVWAELSFNADTVRVTVPMVGLTAVHGQVVYADNSPAAGAEVTFVGMAEAVCEGGCARFADANGQFAFTQLAARSFTVWAADPVRSLKGSVGGTLNPGEDRALRVVLQPSAVVQGRVLSAGGLPAAGVTCELAVGADHLFVATGADGRFSFAAVPLSPYTLDLSDPVGPGVARRNGTLSGNLDLGDIRLDEAPPQVVSLTPAASATRVPTGQVVTIVFSEPVDPAGVTASGISLAGPAGPVTAVLALVSGDTTVTVTPVSPLAQETRYALRVTGIRDRLGKLMPDYTASFTTVDVTAPTFLDVSPAAGASGVPDSSTIRVKYSEPVDPAGFAGTPLALTDGGTAVPGRLDYAFGNTVIAFTPALPLARNRSYRVQVQPARDLAGNVQAAGLDYTFATTDGVPPQVLGLTSLTGSSVIENGTVRVRPDFGGAVDVAVVDYSVNGVPAGSSRTAPFEFAVQVGAALGAPGDSFSITAVATDTSGNRGVASGPLSIAIVADQPPAVAIAAPADGAAFANGARVTVTVTASDDVGLATVAYRAQTGRAQDAGSTTISPPATTHTSSFGFNVPADAAPGSTIPIQASALDTKGQAVSATSVSIRVVDAVPPSVSISGTASGDRVRPGQSVTVTLRADDVGGLTGVTFAATGAAASAESRPIEGGLTSVVTAFTFTVPAGARSGETVLLDGTATDRAGNTGSAARVVLTVADLTPPAVSIRTATGRLSAVPGQALSILASASDDTAVVSVALTGQGAFSYSDSRQVTPPTNSASVTFSLTVPSGAQPGDVLTLTARATDLAGNVSAPATLNITIVSAVEVTLPPSLVALAGEPQQVAFQLSAAAAAGGQVVTFASASPAVATVVPSVTVPEGQSESTVTVTGVAGGTTAVRAYVQGAERASMTVAVQGGVVSGRVVNERFEPVAGVEVTVANAQTATTDAAGDYRVTGVTATSFGVKALDRATGARGYATASLTGPGGYAKNVNLVLVAAGLVTGTVFQADGQTVAGAGVQVDIATQARPWESLGTTFTDADSRFEFPLVMLGDYYVTATATDGNRGRSPLSVTAGGAALDVAITYLGSGTVAGTVRSGAGTPVPNALLQFSNDSALGLLTPVNVAAGPDGTFRFERVLIGTFSIVARDPVSGLAGIADGSITQHGQTVSRDVTVGSYGSVSGTVYRSDGTTTVANAEVRLAGPATLSDAEGRYAFPIVPLGTRTVSVSEAATRGVGRASVTLSASGEAAVADVFLEPQGTLVVTVEDAGGQLVAGAAVLVRVVLDGFSDTLWATTGADGRAVVEHVLAGTYSVTASASGLSGESAGALPPGASLPVVVRLQPTASLGGTVFLPDGETPAVGTVRVNGITQAIGADGSYRYDGLRLGTYTVSAYDTEDRLRAEARNVSLYSPGQLVAQDLAFVAAGTVNGRVLYNGTGAGNLSVQLRSLNPSFGGYFSARTDGAGSYEIRGVPAGPFVVSVVDTVRRLGGEASGTVVSDGQVVTADVNLLNNAITLPLNRYDANGLKYDLQADGSVKTGSNAFYGEGGFKLDVLGASSVTRVTAGGVATSDQGGQQIVVRQDGVAGLNVTRKVYVPLDGYFVRYAEILSNPTGAAITVGARVSSQLGWAQTYSAIVPGIRSTSSGDTAFNPLGADGDRWVVLDDWDEDPFGGTGNFPPATAFVFGGGGAAIAPGAGGYDPSTGRLQYQWDGVTVPAGGQVVLVHFAVQQISQAAARASAERLVQLPPEAIDGLALDEVAAVGNFSMPENGISGVAALPPLRATVSGRVLEGDGISPVNGAALTFKSGHPLFGRTLAATSGASGGFSFTGAATLGQYGGVPVPAWDFVLAARHPLTSAAAPPVAGSFAAGELTAPADVVFSNAGVVSGSIRLHGVPVTAGSVTLLSGSSPVATVGVDTLGVFRFGGVVAGSYTLQAAVPHSQGTGLTGAVAIVVAPGAAQTFDVPLEPTGAVRGTVTTGAGAAAANVLVELARTGFARSTRTDSAGGFAFPDVPVGAFTLQATEPTSTLRTAAAVTVAEGVESLQDLALVGVGIVQGVVRTTGGALAGAGHTVTLTSAVPGAIAYQTATDGASGYRFTGVPVGSVTVTVRNDVQFIFGQAAGSVAEAGQTVTLDVTVADSSVALPLTLVDANGLSFDIQQNGRIGVGTQRAFYGNGGSTGGASLLDIVIGTTANRFNGGARGGQEDGNREVAIVQSGLAGLDVTRKVYVPADGYFARYLEILTNPGAAPITFGLRVSHYVGWWDTRPGIFTTSSGDKVLDNWVASVRDRWVVLNGTDVPDALNVSSAYPSRAFAFDGPDAAQRAGLLTHTTTSYPSLVVEWQNVTLQPGEKAAFLHFVVQQSNNAAGQASAARLVQLPPEAIAGLSGEERSLIRNFSVPGDGTSTLAALPALNGRVSGRVLNEAATGMSGATVMLQSQHPIFARQYSATSASGGSFTLPATAATYFPVHPFTLKGTLPTTASGIVEGTFAEGQATATRDVVISGAGSIAGTVLHMDGTPWSGLSMDLSGNGMPTQTPTTKVGADFTFASIPAGTYTLAIWRPDNGCGLVSWTMPVTVVSGQVTTVQAQPANVGRITGRLYSITGLPVAGANVNLKGGPVGASYLCYATTAADGGFNFLDIPPADLTLSNVRSSSIASVALTLSAGQTITQDLTQAPLGTVVVRTTDGNGNPLSGVTVSYRHTTMTSWATAGTTDALGQRTIANFPAGPFSVRAVNLSNSSYLAVGTGTITTEGQVVSLELVVGGAGGTVTGTYVRPVTAAVIPSASVYLYTADGVTRLASATTNASGGFTFTNVPTGVPLILRGLEPTGYSWPANVSITVPSPGATLAQDVTALALATVRVTVLNPDGTPMASASVYRKFPYAPYDSFYYVGRTDASGVIDLTKTPEGQNVVRVYDPVSGNPYAERTVTVRAADESQVLPLEVRLGAFLTGSITGHVYGSDGVTPASGVAVALMNALEPTGSSIASRTTAADGSYTFANYRQPESGFLVRAGAVGVTASAPAVLTADNQTLTVDLTLPAQALRLTGRVLMADGVTTMPGTRSFSVMRGDTSSWMGSVTTAADGSYSTIVIVPPGLTTVFLRYSQSTPSVSVDTTPVAIPAVGPLALDLPLPLYAGTVSGVATAADGLTPMLDSVQVRVLDASGVELASTWTATDGRYQFTNLATPAAGFALTARYSGNNQVEAYGGSFAENRNQVANFTFPLSVVRGRLLRANGTAVDSPSVSIEGSDGVTRWRMASGVNWFVFGTPVGPFFVTASDGTQGSAIVTASGTVADITVPVVLDLSLPATGTVVAAFRDPGGMPAVRGSAYLALAGDSYVRYAALDSTGRATFTGVPAGRATVQGWVGTSSIWAGGAVDVVGGQTVTVDLQAPLTGSLSGHAYQADGLTPLSGATVRWESFTGAGPGGRPSGSATTDASGVFSFPVVPIGNVLLTIDYQAWAQRLVSPGANTTVTLVADLFTAGQLNGADGFKYEINSSGGASNDGTIAGNYAPLAGAYGLYVNNSGVPGPSTRGLEAGGRQVVIGPQLAGGFVVTRKVYVPAAGGFERFLDIVRNPTATELPLTLRVPVNLAATTGVHLVTSPGSTGNRYLVADDTNGHAPSRAAVAIVAAGAGAVSVPVQGFTAGEGSGSVAVQWKTTVPPGGELAFLHFFAQRPPAAAAEAQAQAEALVGLTDPEALVGLTPAERARIVNFTVPGAEALVSGGSISGRVVAGDGVTPIAGAKVEAMDPRYVVVKASALTSASGAYTLAGLDAGAGLLVTAEIPSSPGSKVAVPAVFPAGVTALTGIDFSLPVAALQGQVLGGDAAGFTVLAAQSIGGSETTRSATVDASGRFTFFGLAAGPVTLTLLDPGLQSAAYLTAEVAAPDVTTNVSLERPTGSACQPPLPGLVGWWRGEGQAADALTSSTPSSDVAGLAYDGAKVGQGFRFAGSGRVVADDSAQLWLSSDALTLTAWVRLDNLAPEVQSLIYRTRSLSGNTVPAYELQKVQTASGHRFRFRTFTATTAEETVLTSATEVTAGRFYHVAVTLDGVAARLYVDGMLEASATRPGFPNYTGGQQYIGGQGTTSLYSSANCFATIDEVQLYDHAMTASQVHQVLAGGEAGSCTDLAHVARPLLPAIEQGWPYSLRLAASTGFDPSAVAFSLTGGSLPDGVSLSAGGILSGTTSSIGRYSFQATATAPTGSATRAFTLDAPACLSLPGGAAHLFRAENDANDLLGGAHGTVAGTVTFDAGRAGQALSFPGVSGAYVVNAVTPAFSNNFTVEFWAKPAATRQSWTESTTTAYSGGQRFAVGGAGAASIYDEYAGVSVGTNGVSVYTYSGSANAHYPVLVYNATLSDWTHVAVVFSDRTPTLYLNGAAVRAGLKTTRLKTYPSLYLGGEPANIGPYQGLLDEVGFYARPLAPSEIAAIYRAGGKNRCQ